MSHQRDLERAAGVHKFCSRDFCDSVAAPVVMETLERLKISPLSMRESEQQRSRINWEQRATVQNRTKYHDNINGEDDVEESPDREQDGRLDRTLEFARSGSDNPKICHRWIFKTPLCRFFRSLQTTPAHSNPLQAVFCSSSEY
jgi:hypothetical protein